MPRMKLGAVLGGTSPVARAGDEPAAGRRTRRRASSVIGFDDEITANAVRLSHAANDDQLREEVGHGRG